MSEDKYDLDLFIKNSFEETIEYLNKIGIKIEGLKLRIFESTEVFRGLGVGEYDGQANEVHIIKSELIKNINKRVNDSNKIFIGNLFTITHSEILWPIYKNDNDIEKIIAKAYTDSILIHEIGHAALHLIGSNDEWKASVFEFLVYFYKNELYKYPEVYEIMERNMRICERAIQEKYPSPYSLGCCFANDFVYIYENILNKDKQSPKLDIKNTIEKLRYFSRDDEIDATKMINTLTKILMLLYK
jgi:hypothetical protein